MTGSKRNEAGAVWTGLLRAGQRIRDAIEDRLKAAGLPPLAWYDVLWELERGPADGLRPVDLQERLLLAQYNLSRLIERLDRAGLLGRHPCPDDGRSQLLRLTPDGAALRRRMWRVYGPAIDELVGAPLEGEDLAALRRILDRLR